MLTWWMELLEFLLLEWDGSQDVPGDAEQVSGSSWKSAKWRAVARIVRVKRPCAEELDGLLQSIAGDRFSSPEVLLAVADAAVAVARAAESLPSLLGTPAGDVESFPALLKQFYVTLNDSHVRRDISAVLVAMVQSKDHAKLLLRSQILRSVLRVAVDRSSFHTGGNDLPLVNNCVELFRCIVAYMCDAVDDATEGNGVQVMCEMIVRLMLSRSTLAFEEGVRMLQTAVETSACRTHIIACIHLRGALEKAHRFSELKPGGLASDPYLVMLCEEHYAHLRPEIDELERKQGSLVQLPSEIEVSQNSKKLMGTDVALQEALRCKERGNWFFRRGNFPTARAFYRHAVLVLRLTQRREEQRLEQLPRTAKLERCNVGASVQVRVLSSDKRTTVWRNAMIADVEDDRHIEVVFDEQPNADADSDGQDDEEVVTLDRIRLQLNTKTLNEFSRMQVDCYMNMGKAASGMHDYECAVEGFSSALELDPTNAAALYHRGVSYMALHNLKPAQQDLWSANQHCHNALKSNSSHATTTDEYQKQLKAAKALQRQVATAYKRLQQLNASKKKMDKKVIKEMMRYLSSIPGLQGDQ